MTSSRESFGEQLNKSTHTWFDDMTFLTLTTAGGRSVRTKTQSGHRPTDNGLELLTVKFGILHPLKSFCPYHTVRGAVP